MSSSFWLRYAPNRLSAKALPRPHWGAYSAPSYPLAGLGVVPRGKGRREGRGKRRVGKREEGIPECPNPEFASLIIHRKKAVKCEINIVLIKRNHC